MIVSGAVWTGLAAGAVWNLLNIEAFRRLAAALTAPEKNRKTLWWILLAKFGLLYPAAIVLLWSGICSRAAFAVGVTVVLAFSVVRIMKLSNRGAHV